MGAQQAGTDRKRARQHGIGVGVLEPGRHNAITDVEGVRVGHCTISRIDPEGEKTLQTGVTALPRYG